MIIQRPHAAGSMSLNSGQQIDGSSRGGAVEYTLTIVTAHGTVAKNPDQATYHLNDVVALTATPSASYVFDAWSGDHVSSDNPTNVTITGDMTVTAGYDPYLLQDEFTTPAAAPLANPLTMEPGGTVVTTWTLTDPVPKFSKSGGEFIQGTGGSNGATKKRSTQALSHLAGRAVAMRLTGVTAAGVVYLGLYPTDVQKRQFEFTPAYGAPIYRASLSGTTLRGISVTVPKVAGIVWKDNGATYAFIDDNLVYSSDPLEDANKSDSYVWIYNYMAANTMNVDWVRAGDLGAPWNTDYGLATTHVAAPISGQVGVHTADFHGYLNWTVGAGETLLWNFRKSDASNYYQLVCDQAANTIKLYRVVAGTPTELTPGKTMTWTVGEVNRFVLGCIGGVVFVFMRGITDKFKSAEKFFISGETFNLTATGSDISGFATATHWELNPVTLTGAAKTEKDRFFQ